MLFFCLCLLLFASFVELFLRKTKTGWTFYKRFNLVMVVAY